MEVEVRVEDAVAVELWVGLLLVVGSGSAGEVVVVVVAEVDFVVGVDVVTDVGWVLGASDAVGEAAAEWTGVTPSEDRSNGLGDGDALVNGGAVTAGPADTGACGSDSEAAACSGVGLLAVGRPQAASRTAAMPCPAAIITVRREG